MTNLSQINNVSKERISGIELLKIIAILLIIISHVTQTLSTDLTDTVGFNDYFIDLGHSTSNISIFLLVLFRYFGIIGNAIFFVCSAWFLIDSKKTNYQKIITIILDTFLISICWLIPVIAAKGFNYVGTKLLIKSLFPTFFSNNWYITAYILFCFISPFLNIIIRNINEKTHLLIASALFLCHLLISFFYDFPQTSILFVWISIYFVISYFKNYHHLICDSAKINVVLLCSGLLGIIVIVSFINFAGLKIDFLSNKNLYFIRNSNFLTFFIAFGSFNLFKKLRWKSSAINFVSSVSLFVYAIHENILFRQLIRPYFFQWIYNSFGYDYIVVWILLISISLFLLSVVIAILFKYTLHHVSTFASNKIYTLSGKMANSFSRRVIKDTDEHIDEQ